jgi:succinoglycan biosynthesis transport protein ExoP
MEIKSVIRTFRRWFWLIILGTVIGGVSGLLIGLLQTPTYQAITKVLVTRMRQETNSDFAYLNDQQLTQTYIELLLTKPVLDEVSKQLLYEVDPKQVQVQQVKDTTIIQITVEDHDPELAASIANSMVNVLIEHNQELQAGQYTSSENALELQIAQVENQMNGLQSQFNQYSQQDIEAQLAEVDAQITDFQNEITNLQRFISQNSPPTTDFQKSQVAEKQARLDLLQPILTQYQQIRTNLLFLGKPAETGNVIQDPQLMQLQSTIDLYQQIYLNLLNNRETIRLARLQNTPNVSQIEVAGIPIEPIRPVPLIYTLLAGFLGLIVGSGLAILADYLDNSIKTPADVSQTLNLPVLSSIPEIKPKGLNETSENRLDMTVHLQSFYTLLVNLDYIGKNRSLKTILVSSPGPSEGKTTVATNLALSLVRTGRKVILLDANFIRPELHNVFGLENQVGLIDAILRNADLKEINNDIPEIKGLSVLTSGINTLETTETFVTANFLELLQKLKKNYDSVIIDSAPLFFPDVMILAPKVDSVLFVVQPWHTQANTAKASIEQLNQCGANVLGVVLNRIPRSLAYYYDDYKYAVPDLEEYSSTRNKNKMDKEQLESQEQEPKPDMKWNTYPDIFRE